MAGDLGTLSLEFTTRFDTSQLVAGGKQAAQVVDQVGGSFDRLGSIFVPATSGLSNAADGFDTVRELMANTHAITNQLARSMKGLFAAQKRVASGSRKMSKDMVQSFHDINAASQTSREAFEGKLDKMTAPHPQRGVSAVSGDAKAAQALLEENRRRQEVINNVLRQRVGPVKEAAKWVAELNRLVGEQGELEQEVLRFNNELVEAEQRKAVAAREVAEDKERQARATQKQMDAQQQLRATQDREQGQQLASEERAAHEEEMRMLREAIVAREEARAFEARERARYADEAASDERAAQDQAFSDLKADIIRRNRERIEGEREARRQQEAVAQHREIGEDVLTARRPEGGPKTSGELSSQLKREEATAKGLFGQFKKIYQERARALNIGEDIEDGEKRIKRAADEYKKSLLTIERTKKRLEKATEDEAAEASRVAMGYRDAHVMMQQLGNSASATVLIEQKVAENAERFAEAMERARLSGSHTAEQLEAMQEQFNKVNTARNVAGQMKGGNLGGAAIQQAAFGLEDFASQIERGVIPALGGAANNINMIVSMLGPPWLSVVSVAAIAGIQFSKALGLIGGESETTSEKLQSAENAVKAMTARMQASRDTARMRIELQFDPDIESITGRMKDVVSANTDVLDQLGEATRKVLARQTQEAIDNMGGFVNWITTRPTVIAENYKRAWDRNTIDWAAGLGETEAEMKKREALDGRMAGLGAGQTEEMLLQVQLQKQLRMQAESFVKIEERLADLATERLNRMQFGLGPQTDERNVAEALNDAVKAEDKRKKLSAEIRDLQKEQKTLAAKWNDDLDERNAQQTRLKEINDAIQERQVAMTKEAEKFTAAAERHAEVLQASNDAYESIEEKIRDIQSVADDTQGALRSAEKVTQEWNEQLDLVRNGIDGIARAQHLQEQLIRASRDAAHRRLQEAAMEGQQEKELHEQIIHKLALRNNTIDRANELEEKVRSGLVTEEEARHKILAMHELAVEAATDLAALQKEARTAIEGEQKAIEQKLGSLDKEFAKRKKIADEREKLERAITAGRNAGIIDAKREQEIRTAFRVAMDSETRMQELKRELSETANVAPAAPLAQRDSQEAQNIIFQAMREGQARNDQQPVIEAIQKVVQAVNEQTKVIERPSQEPGIKLAELDKL